MVVFRNIGIFVEMCILIISLRKSMEKMEKRSRKLNEENQEKGRTNGVSRRHT